MNSAASAATAAEAAVTGLLGAAIGIRQTVVSSDAVKLYNYDDKVIKIYGKINSVSLNRARKIGRVDTMNRELNVTMALLSATNYSDYGVTLSSNTSSFDRFITVLQTTVIAVVSSGIILSNIINLIVLVSASAAMPWATRLFLINLSVSDVLVGFVACAPAVLPAATDRWTYGDYLTTETTERMIAKDITLNCYC